MSTITENNKLIDDSSTKKTKGVGITSLSLGYIRNQVNTFTILHELMQEGILTKDQLDTKLKKIHVYGTIPEKTAYWEIYDHKNSFKSRKDFYALYVKIEKAKANAEEKTKAQASAPKKTKKSTKKDEETATAESGSDQEKEEIALAVSVPIPVPVPEHVKVEVVAPVAAPAHQEPEKVEDVAHTTTDSKKKKKAKKNGKEESSTEA